MQRIGEMTHLTHKTPKLSNKISNLSNFYMNYRGFDLNISVFVPKRFGLNTQ